MKNLLPIDLGIARKGDPFLAHKDDEKLQLMKQQIHERDNHTCQFCGFHSKKYQQIVQLNETEKLDIDNAATACIFCHQCFHLDNVANMKSGFFIWLPEMSQAELHHIVRSIYVAQISQGPMAETAKKIHQEFMSRRADAENRIGTSDPYVMMTVLSSLVSRRTYAGRSQKLDGIRLFPLNRRIIKEKDLEFNQFPQILAYWRSKDGPYAGKTPTSWIDIYKNFPGDQRAAA